MVSKNSLRDKTLAANISIHSALVESGQYEKSPHFFSENIEKVAGILERVTAGLPEKTDAKAVDFGCGTGFMINLIKGRFAEIHGVDITPAMMARIDTSSGNIFLHETLAEATPFGEDTFDLATAYSFMDHLHRYEDFLSEVYRVLKPGGVFYSDLNPNKDFILAMDRLEKRSLKEYPDILQKEIQGALHNGEYYEKHFSLDAKTLEMAEPVKSLDQGFDADTVITVAKDIGFRSCQVEFEWFLGQGKVMHQQSPVAAQTIDSFLRSILPASSSIYKYLRFVFKK